MKALLIFLFSAALALAQSTGGVGVQPIARGGTGATTAANARLNLGVASGYSVVATNVAALKATSVAGLPDGTVIVVLGFTSAGDGGGGIFRYSAGSATAADGGTVFAPDVGAGRWFRQFSGALNVQWFGAKGDNTADDTSSIQAAIDAAAASNGGVVEFPAGRYLCNVVVQGNNITISGAMGSPDLVSPTCLLRPFVDTSPTVTVGDGVSEACRKVVIRGLSISGKTKAGTQAPAALRYQGAVNCYATNFSLTDGVKTLHLEGSATQPVTCCDFSQFNIRNDYADTSGRALYVKRHAGSYTTGITFHGGHFNGGTGSLGYCVEINDEIVSFSGVYCDMQDGLGFYLNSAFVHGMNLNLDPGVVGGVVVELNDTVIDPSRYMSGSIVAPNHKIKNSLGATITIPSTWSGSTNGGRHQAPYLGHTVYFSPISDPFSETDKVEMSGVGGTFNFHMAGGVEVRGSNLWIWGGNAQRAAQITSNDANGGLYVAASSSAANADIRFVPKGAGRFRVETMPEYADNAAAVAAGLPVGAFYRTGDALKIVH